MVATTVLTGRVSSTGRLPVPGKQVADAIDGMVGDAGEHIAQICLQVELTRLGGLDEASFAILRNRQLSPVHRLPPPRVNQVGMNVMTAREVRDAQPTCRTLRNEA